MHSRLTVAALPALMLLMAGSDVPLASGMWEIRNAPGVATLNGRELNELPIGPIESSRICLSDADVADPAIFFRRDLDPACKTLKVAAAGGQVTIEGTCPNQLEGPEGRFELRGKYAQQSYEVDFATTAFGDNGRMTFSGKLTGRRIGDCASGS